MSTSTVWLFMGKILAYSWRLLLAQTLNCGHQGQEEGDVKRTLGLRNSDHQALAQRAESHVFYLVTELFFFFNVNCHQHLKLRTHTRMGFPRVCWICKSWYYHREIIGWQ